MLAVHSSRLQIISSAHLIQLATVSNLGNFDVDTGPQTGADVSRTEGQVAEFVVADELEHLLHGVDRCD